MKKILSIGIVLAVTISLTACGDTPEEKNQKIAAKEGLKALMDLGKMAQKGASDEDLGKAAIDKFVSGVDKLEGKNGEKITKEEQAKLKEGLNEGMDFMKEMVKMGDAAEKNGRDDEVAMDFFGKMAEMQLKYDKDMTDEEKESAEAAAKMFKDGGKKFKENLNTALEEQKREMEQMQKEADAEEAAMKKEIRENLFTRKKYNFKIALSSLDGATMTKTLREAGVPTIGCDDVVIYKELTGESNAKEILERMFTFDGYDEDKGEYNVFQSSDLKVDDLSIDNNYVVTVKLSGNLSTGGMCDNPRVGAQITQTIKMVNPTWIKDVKIFINGEPLGDFLSEKGGDDVMDTEIEGEDTGIVPVEYDELVDNPAIYQDPPSATQSFILTHNGDKWEDVCFENLGNPADLDILVAKRKSDVLDDEWSFIKYNATTANMKFVDKCPAKYDVSCEYEDKEVSFELHFDSDNPNDGDVSASEKTGNLKYRTYFSPKSYNTDEEKGMIQMSCAFQENKVQGIADKLNADGEWK